MPPKITQTDFLALCIYTLTNVTNIHTLIQEHIYTLIHLNKQKRESYNQICIKKLNKLSMLSTKVE